jgi:hypothetical protein
VLVDMVLIANRPSPAATRLIAAAIANAVVSHL